jgi:hypothetical protein
MIVISPVQGGVSSPMLNVQAAMTGAVASGTKAFDGLPMGTYTAYVFSNPNGTDRGAEPRISVTFTVEEKPLMATPTGDIPPPAAKKNAADLYKEKLETVWAAMSEPYCGYGSRGTAAVQKSFNKNIARIRDEFVKATTPPAPPKAVKTVDAKVTPKK